MPRHVSSIPVRWSDVDQLGHVNNVVLLRYLQEARVDMLFRDASNRGTNDLASGVLVHRHDVSYHAPIHLESGTDGRPLPVRVELQVTRTTAASFEISYHVLDSRGRVCATACSVLVPYDLDGNHLRRVTAAERAVLDSFGDVPFSLDGPGPAAWPDGAMGAFSTMCAVRFDDLDSYGHVNNVMIAEYLQQVRIDLNRGLLDNHRDAHEQQVVARQSIDYVRPIPFRTDPVTVDVIVTRIGTSSFDLACLVRDDTTVFARANAAMVAYDVPGAASRPLTEGERAVLERLRAPVRSAA